MWQIISFKDQKIKKQSLELSPCQGSQEVMFCNATHNWCASTDPRRNTMSRHLNRLPPKSFKVAPGDVIGGLIYVMDKPLGIEEGMVGISIDSEPYRNFVKEQLGLCEQIRLQPKKINELDPKTHPHIKALSKRYNQLYHQTQGFKDLTEKETIDLVLQDKIHKKRRYGASFQEFKDVFFSFSKYHEMKGLQRYYENKGMGGLLFSTYQHKCDIKKTDHFAKQIAKLIKDGNKAYMIKQDGKMSLGGTGPGWKKMLKTNTGKSLQKLVNPFVIICTGGLSALAFGIGMLAWRGFYLFKNKPDSANSDAIIEALSTNMATKRGMNAQEIETIKGTYPNGTPKIATAVTWAPGCRDLSGKLAGSQDWSSVIVTWDKNEEPIKVDKNGNIIRTKEKDESGKIVSYEKILKNGTIKPATLQEYHEGTMVSDDKIAGLGESLISFISMGDRDGIGKMGQNKAILPMDPPQGNKIYQFYGIDFGKSYKADNPIIHSLRDDFSFDNPASRNSRFVNYSILYDNPLREKMKGIYLLAALRGQLSLEKREAIAKEYESGNDRTFADKLRGYPDSVGGVNSDIKLIDKEIEKYQQDADKLENTLTQKAQYLEYVNRLKEVKKIATETDRIVLDKFSTRVELNPYQIDILDNIEKLTSAKVHTTTPDGKVQLNHIRVERSDRTPWQLQDNKNGTFTLVCEDKQNIQQIKRRLSRFPDPKEVKDLLQTSEVDKGTLVIKNLTQDDLQLLSQQFTEQQVAKTRNLPYRSQETRANFHECLKSAKHHKPDVIVVPQRFSLAAKKDKADNVEHVGLMYKNAASRDRSLSVPVSEAEKNKVSRGNKPSL